MNFVLQWPAKAWYYTLVIGTDERINSLDNWKPRDKVVGVIPKSTWRKEVIEDYQPGLPGRDDLKKIRYYIKKGASRKEILTTFNIKRTVLAHILCNLYCPVDGMLESNNERSRRYAKLRQQEAKRKAKGLTCTFVDGELHCHRPVKAKQLCQMHYTQMLKRLAKSGKKTAFGVYIDGQL